MKPVYNYVYKYGVLIGYSCKYGFIEKHYDKPYNYNLPQKIDYRVKLLKEKGKDYIFNRLNDAKKALETEAKNEKL